MKIQYKVEQDDLHAFLIYTMRNNYEIKRQRRKTCIVIAACSLLIATYFAYQKQSIFPLIWFGLFGGYLLHMSRRVPTLSKKQASRLYPENNNQSVLCEHTLELTESGIVETTHTGSQVTKFSGIYKVVDLSEYGFIFIGAHMAHIIPKDKILSGNLGEFMVTLTERWESQMENGKISSEGEAPSRPSR